MDQHSFIPEEDKKTPEEDKKPPEEDKKPPEEDKKPVAVPSRRKFRGKRKRSEIEPGFPKPCDLCKVVCNRLIEYEAHMSGKRHSRELKKIKVKEQLEKMVGAESNEPTKEVVVTDPKTSLRTCTVCSVPLQSPMVERSHLKGRKHQKKIQKMIKISNGPIVPRPPRKGYVGRCEICNVSYTSPVMMESHLAGKHHRKKCRTSVVPDVRGWTDTQPPAKMMKLRPLITPPVKTAAEKKEAYEVLEKKAEEAYEKYKSIASTIPLEQAQALYLQYQTIYRAYEAAYKEHMASKQNIK